MDKELNIILEAKSGNEQAFSEIAKKYKQLVSNIAKKYYIVGGDSDDIVQEGMIALYNAILTYDKDKQISFYSYAKTCIENRIKNLIKSDNSYKNFYLNDSVKYDAQGDVVKYNNVTEKSSVWTPIDVVNSPEETIANNENEKLLKDEIESKLSGLEYDVLTLFLEGESYEQISKTLKINVKSVDNALNRIKNKLKYLKQNYKD